VLVVSAVEGVQPQTRVLMRALQRLQIPEWPSGPRWCGRTQQRYCCDTTNNLSTKALTELGDGAAHAVMTLARTRTGFFEDGSLRQAPYTAPKFDRKGPSAIR